MFWPITDRSAAYAIVNDLTVDFAGKKKILYSKFGNHLIIPREFIPPSTYKTWSLHGIPIFDLRPKYFPSANMVAKTKPWDDQKEAIKNIVKNEGGILGLACGRGKTVISLMYAAMLNLKTVVVVHTQDLMQQWVERIEDHIHIPKNKIGIIQGKNVEIENTDIVVAMIQTLASKRDTLPLPWRESIGLAIYDEVHHLSAPTFSKTADLFPGIRLGLSATPKREDNLEFVYQFHLGGMIFEDYHQDLTPEVYFQVTDVQLNYNNREVLDKSGKPHDSKIMVWLGTVKKRNEIIKDLAVKSLDANRTVMILVHGREHALELGKMIPGSGVAIGGVPKDKRWDIMKNKNVIIATMRIGREAIDRAELDTVIFSTPFKSEGMFRQGIGRALRKKDNKKPPFIIVLEDYMINTCRSKCKELMQHSIELGYKTYSIGKRYTPIDKPKNKLLRG